MKIVYFIILLAAISACQCGTKRAYSDNRHSDADIDAAYVIEDDGYVGDDGYVCASEDGRITIESGIRPDGGTAPDYWAKWTIISKDGEKHEIRFGYTSFKRKIHTLNKTDGSVYYIVECFSKASSCDGYDWLEAYRIVGDTIKMVKVMDGSDKADDDCTEFGVNYSIPDWYFATDGAGYDWMMDYDKASGNLYVPLVEDRQITDRYDVWHFNGDRFECIGQRPHRDLYGEMSDYNCLIQFFTTKDYLVRVDSLETGGLRYASWKKPKTMEDKPDIVLTGGVTVKHPVPSDELQPCDDYRFAAGQYEYIVNYCETKRNEEGYGEHHDYLLVKKGDKVILKQEKVVDD